MSSPHRGHLLARAAALLEAHGNRLQKVTLHATDGSRTEIVLRPGEELPDVTSGPPLPARVYSPVEREIITALAGRDWVTTPALAEMLGREASTLFRSIVTNLADAGILETSRQGVRLARGDRAASSRSISEIERLDP